MLGNILSRSKNFILIQIIIIYDRWLLSVHVHTFFIDFFSVKRDF